MHILLVALLGSEAEDGAHTPLLEPMLVLGWELR